MISITQQRKICSTISALCTASHLSPEDRTERQHLLFIGVAVGLADQLPPYWSACIMSATTDRLMADYGPEAKKPVSLSNPPLKAGD